MWFLGWKDSGKSCITLDLQTTEVPRVFGIEDAVVQDVLHPEWRGGSFEGQSPTGCDSALLFLVSCFQGAPYSCES